MPTKEAIKFFNLYNHGFIRTAVCIPELKVADTFFNTQKTIELAREAASRKVILAIFPELGLSAYSNEDLFHQDALLQSVREGIAKIKKASEKINTIIVTGAPLQVDCRLFNCAVVFYCGQILGVAIKSYLPNYREFYEARQFTPATAALSYQIELAGQKNIPFGGLLRGALSRCPGLRRGQAALRSSESPRRRQRRRPARCSCDGVRLQFELPAGNAPTG